MDGGIITKEGPGGTINLPGFKPSRMEADPERFPKGYGPSLQWLVEVWLAIWRSLAEGIHHYNDKGTKISS